LAADRADRRAAGGLARGLLALASLGLVLAALELGVRALDRPPPRRAVPPPPEGVEELRGMLALVRPDQDAWWAGAPYRTNAGGFRGPEWSPEPAPGTYRIAVAGDSVAAGQGVAVEDAFPARLEALLRAEGRPVEVANLALAGADARRVMGRLAAALRRYRFDLHVYAWTSNDIEGPAYRASPPDAQRRWRRDLARFRDSRSALLRFAWARWMGLRERFFAPPGSRLHDQRANYFDNPAAWRDFTAELDRLAQLSRDAGVCGHVLVNPALVQLDGRHPYRAVYAAVAAAARERGLSASRTFEGLVGLDARHLWLSPVDPHPNVEGHRRIAYAVAERLPRDLPARCGLPPAGGVP